jgi:hypothetical protein
MQHHVEMRDDDVREAQKAVVKRKQREGATVDFADARIEAVLLRGRTTDCDHVYLVDGRVVDTKEAVDLMLPTSTDTLACGYRPNDLSAWILGEASASSFSVHNTEKALVGVPDSHWYYHRRRTGEQGSEVYDTSWRTRNNAKHARAENTESKDGKEQPRRNAEPSAGSPTNSDRELWALAHRVAKDHDIGIGRFNIEPVHIYDRIKQMMWATESEGRLVLQVSDDLEDLTNVEKLKTDVNASFMCSVKDGTAPADVAGKPIEDIIQHTDAIASKANAAVHPIPLAAVSFRGANCDAELQKKTMRVARTWHRIGAPELTDVEAPDCPGQRRFDKLIACNALPGVWPLTAKPTRVCPIRSTDSQLLVASSFVVQIAKLGIEVARTTATIPGMRALPVKALPSHGDATSSRSADSVERIEQREGQLPSTDVDVGQLALSMARAMKQAGRTSASKDDIAEFMRRVSYKIASQQEQKFDVFSIFLVDRLHQLFNHDHDDWYTQVTKRFPEVFSKRDDVVAALPETATAYLPADSSLFDQAPLLVSVQKRVESTATDVAQPTRKRKFAHAALSPRDMAAVHLAKRAEHGGAPANPTDAASLTSAQAPTHARAPLSERVLTHRGSFCENLRMARWERGIARRGDAFDRAGRDIGIGLIARARGYFAENPAAPCDVKWIADEAAYLRPYTCPRVAGTCREVDATIVELTINHAFSSLFADDAQSNEECEGGPSAEEKDHEDDADDCFVDAMDED